MKFNCKGCSFARGFLWWKSCARLKDKHDTDDVFSKGVLAAMWLIGTKTQPCPVKYRK